MPDLAVFADLLKPLIGRTLIEVTEARHWYGGTREGDSESLLHFWLHFADVPPLMAHACGDVLQLCYEDPYPSYDMQEYGETRVGPVRSPDLLATVVGQRLRDIALVQGYDSVSRLGGLLLRFEPGVLLLATLWDEWILAEGGIPESLQRYLTIGSWISGTSVDEHQDSTVAEGPEDAAAC
jgi:hypothetical protein